MKKASDPAVINPVVAAFQLTARSPGNGFPPTGVRHSGWAPGVRARKGEVKIRLMFSRVTGLLKG